MFWPEHDVENNAVVIGVCVVVMAVPVGGVQVQLDVADYLIAVLGDDNGVVKVRPRA